MITLRHELGMLCRRSRTVVLVHGGWALAGAGVGLVAGGLLRTAVLRLSVPAGAPQRAACPGCGETFALWATAGTASEKAGSARRAGERWVGARRLARLAGGRCARCRRRLGPPPAALELATGALLALVAGVVGGRVELVAFGWIAVVGVALAAVDLAVQRLPDRLVLPGYPVVLGALALAAALGGEPARLLRAVAAGLALAGCYLVLLMLRPGQLGAGDLKLSGLLGLALGWLGWPAVLRGTFLAFLLFSLCGLALLATRRVRLRTELPFGPFMLAGALLALLLRGVT